jgi:hypothetical protein
MINLQSLAALGVRLLGLGLLLFTLPQTVPLVSAMGMGMSDPNISKAALWPVLLYFSVPIVAMVMIGYARPIGRLIARGIE